MIRKRRRRQREDDEGGELPLTLSPDFEITPGLVPVGISNFYQSPAEPVSPTDCDRWPNSPYCGGIPLSTDRLALGNEFSVNPCEICLTITPTLGFVELPPYTICYRRDSPECKPQIPVFEPPPPGPGSFQNPRRQCLEGYYKIEVEANNLEQFVPNLQEYVRATIPAGTELGDAVAIYQDWQSRVVAAYIRAELTAPGARITGTVAEEAYPYEPQNNPYLPSNVVFVNNEGEKSNVGYYVSPGLYNSGKVIYYSATSDWGDFQIRSSATSFFIDYAAIDAIFPACLNQAPNTRPVDAPPYPANRGCCMSCCNGNNSETEELVRLIAKRLGTSDYPIPVPQSMLADRGGGKKTIESLSQFLHWFILQFDAIVGQFPLEIEITDTDPTEEGDQKEKIKIPNLAEGIAEILGTGINSHINTQTLINSGIRTLVEAGGAKIHALETRYIVQAIADYLAFDAKEIKTDVGMTFTPGKTQLDELLQESEQKIPMYTYTDDRDFKAEMTELLFAAAITRAVHYRKVSGDPKDELKRRFMDLIKFADNPLEPPSSGDEDRPKPKTDFDDFMEQVETGFMNTAGIDDPSKPYGRPFEERPRIRELGNTADNTDARI